MRRNTLFAILGATAIIAGIVVWNAQREPVIRGEPLSWWLGNNRSSTSDFKLALAEMDAKCVRFLIREINWQPDLAPGTTQIALPHFQGLAFSRGRHDDHRRGAALILGELGPLAQPAIPSLRKLAHPSSGLNAPDMWLEGVASAALIKLGDESVAPYADRILDPNNVEWKKDWVTLVSLRTNASLLIPRFATAFNASTDPEFRRRFAFSFSRVQIDHELSVPILETLLKNEDRWVRYQAVADLAKFGAEAKSALPELIALLQSEPEYRGIISNALLRIDPDVFSKPEFENTIRR